jgi:4-amino-4-deoxy-L-arabinose transferase-like glycosyltransferase
MTASILLFYSAVKYNRPADKIALYITLGLGTLAKGPVALLIPGLIFVIYLLITRNFNLRTILKLNPFTGFIIFLAVTLPWYILAHIATGGEWTKGFFLGHNINRFSNTMEGHGGIFLLTWVYVFIGMIPFSFYLLQAYRHFRNNSKNNFIILSVVAALVPIIFFSFSRTKLPNYTVIAYPFIAVFLGYYLGAAKVGYRSEKVALILFLAFSVISLPAAWIAMGYDPVLKTLRHTLAWFIVLPAGAILSVGLIAKGLFLQARITLGITVSLAALFFFIGIYPAIDGHNPVVLSKEIVHDKKVVYYRHFNPAYAFELKKHIPEISAGEINQFFRQNPDGLIISRKNNIQDIEFPEGYGIIFSQKDIFEIPTTVLIGSLDNQTP